MLLTHNFLKIIAQGYQTSPTIVGQLLAYNDKHQKFEITSNQVRLKIRWILLDFIAFLTVTRILDLKLNLNKAEKVGSSSVETNLCKMMLFIFVVVGERYRIRGTNPNDFVSFLNGALQMEKFYEKGMPLWKMN